MKSLKALKLNNAIDAIFATAPTGPIPDITETKNRIRLLVEEITGEQLLPRRPYRIGDRFQFKGSSWILAVASNDHVTPQKVIAININTGARRGSVGTAVKNLYYISDLELKSIFAAIDLRNIVRYQKSAIEHAPGETTGPVVYRRDDD